MTMENNEAVRGQSLRGGEPRGADEAFARRIAGEVVRIIDDRWGEAFARLAAIPQIRTAVNAVRRDAAYMVGRLDGEAGMEGTGFESCTLKGAKRRQFLRFCELKRSNPGATIRKCARMALDEIRASDGYTDVDALGEYAAMHRSWWIVRERPADCSVEGGAR